jgi:Na+-transporting NADH:ubiquinone oxidoreductase subunit NqrE
MHSINNMAEDRHAGAILWTVSVKMTTAVTVAVTVVVTVTVTVTVTVMLYIRRLRGTRIVYTE